MEINKTGYINQLYTNETVQQPKQAEKEQAPVQKETEKKDDVVNISSEIKDLQLAKNAAEAPNAEREERVSQLKQAYENGNYTVDAGQVAEKMVGSILNDYT